ncbi:tyrosine-type recombinase/integrase [Tamlana fucoidanivorans]|uniref:Integrase n=1 Tax=Allotamlana fucoidanivorans TaxID=2583814 RepID=A0A5C4SF57_9FLAO|nr:site-specific integrase [Tamlana fucoidanivorans]TNJ41345.1 integrase [Tamlana fucoidanivorans]
MSIYVRFWDSKRIDQKTKTGISVIYNDWSERKQRIKVKPTKDNDADYLNNNLDELEKFVIRKYNRNFSSGEFISKTWLKETVKEFHGRVDSNEEHKAYLVSWVEKFVTEAPSRLYRGKQIKPRSVKNYTTTLNKLKDFEKYQKKRYRFEELDLSFHKDLINYCRNEEKLNDNSIGNIISRVKTFCREIELEGYPISPQYKSSNFHTPKNETFDTYLNEDEINKIFKHDFSDNERLDNVRDLFIIGLRTGLRVSDFLRIESENILGNVINITTLKTQQNLTIPIHPQFQTILDKRGGAFPKKISDQKFNKYIKEVCKEAEIDTPTYGSGQKENEKKKSLGVFPKHQLIGSHCCRRSFASNLFAAGIETSVIMKATGHKTESQFIKYIKLTQNEHIKKLSEYWSNQDK